MIRNIIIATSLIFFLGHAHLFAFSTYHQVQHYYTEGLAEKHIAIIDDDEMETRIPRYIDPDITQENLDIGKWISVLPIEYQDKDAYFIFPKGGIVIPVVEVTDEERQIMDQGGSIDYLHYLQQGALHHRGTNPMEGPGNFTIAGHTSYFKDDTGDFKTDMQGIFLADTGDILIYAKKTGSGTFHRFLYHVTKSYETSPSDVSILLPSDPQAYELTVYGCSPIGSLKNRWVVSSSLISDETFAVTIDGGASHAAAPLDSLPAFPSTLLLGSLGYLITPLPSFVLMAMEYAYAGSLR